jgi:hypothetical protein
MFGGTAPSGTQGLWPASRSVILLALLLRLLSRPVGEGEAAQHGVSASSGPCLTCMSRLRQW